MKFDHLWFKVIIRLTSAKVEVEIEAALGNKSGNNIAGHPKIWGGSLSKSFG